MMHTQLKEIQRLPEKMVLNLANIRLFFLDFLIESLGLYRMPTMNHLESLAPILTIRQTMNKITMLPLFWVGVGVVVLIGFRHIKTNTLHI